MEIIRYETLQTKDGLKRCAVVQYENTEYSVLVYDWQDEHQWSFPTLRCVIKKIFPDGTIHFKAKDTRHSLYVEGGVYEFSVTGTLETSPTTLRIEGPTGDAQVLRLKSNQLNEQDGYVGPSTIQCEFLGTTSKPNFKLCHKDLYFCDEQILIKELSVNPSIFEYIFQSDELSLSKVEQDIRNQYNNKSAFWILTFVNRYLPRKFHEACEIQDFEQAIIWCNLVIESEKWIRRRGILQALNSEKRREAAEKAKRQIETYELYSSCISAYQNHKIENYVAQVSDVRAVSIVLSFSLRYLPIEYTKHWIIASVIFWLKKEDFRLEIGLRSRETVITVNHISQIKNKYWTESSDDYFVRSNVVHHNDRDKFNLFLSLTIIQLELLICAREAREAWILLSKLFRYYTYLRFDTTLKKVLLKCAFQVLENRPNVSSFEYFDVEYYEPILKVASLARFSNTATRKDSNLSQGQILDVSIERETLLGYECKSDESTYHLSQSEAFDVALKRYPLSLLDGKTKVRIECVLEELGCVVVRQLKPNDDGFVSMEHPEKRILPVDFELIGVVKNVLSYGCFVYTRYGDGLIRNENMRLIDKNGQRVRLEKGQVVRVQVLESTSQGGQVQHYLRLINCKVDIIEFVNPQNGIYESLENRIEIELFKRIQQQKAMIIERYGLLQSELSTLIVSFSCARWFYSSISSARSYLMNVYLDYFEIVDILNKLLKENYSVKAWNSILPRIERKMMNVNHRTIEQFPEAENLVYFLKLLLLYNDVQNDTIKNLMDELNALMQPKQEINRLKHILVKSVLSNALILSESQEEEMDMEFSRKNLTRIRDYVWSGVFSIQDTQEDHLKSETAKKLNYWRARILGDETSDLEFKSSLKTPIPDSRKAQIINTIKGKLANAKTPTEANALMQRIDEMEGENAQRAVVHSAMKAIVAFANTSGGTVLLGVADDLVVSGLNLDYENLGGVDDKSRDRFSKFLDDKIQEYLGDSFQATYMDCEFIPFPEGDVLAIKVHPASELIVLMKDENGKESHAVYVRHLASSRELKGYELLKYHKDRILN